MNIRRYIGMGLIVVQFKQGKPRKYTTCTRVSSATTVVDCIPQTVDCQYVTGYKLRPLETIMKPLTNDSIFEPMSMPFHKSVEKIADSATTQKLLIPFYDRKRSVSADEIVRLEGSGNYTNFFLKDGTKMLVSRTLKEYETLLTDESFVRVHKSCIVNLSFVRKFFIKKEGELELTDGQQVKISRRRAQMFMDRIRSYQSVLVN